MEAYCSFQSEKKLSKYYGCYRQRKKTTKPSVQEKVAHENHAQQ